MKLERSLIAAAVCTAAVLFGWSGEAQAGCKITFKARNSAAHKHMVWWTRSDVRNLVGIWRRIPGGPNFSPLQQGESFSIVREMDFACNAKRRYRFMIRKHSEQGAVMATHMYYLPSANGFTEAVVIDLGDLARFFQ